ncbi:MAG TPA: outer membrane exchange protein TraA family protein [Myxococcales bacterium]|nr:outer membrane exchange protein TraA family protein [Myxococcales bacterium]
MALVVTAGAAGAQPTPVLVNGGSVAPAVLVSGAGLCSTSAVSNNPGADFPQGTSTFSSGINQFLDARVSTRVTAVMRTPFDLSNNNQTGLGLSQGDFTDANLPSCPSWGCPFFVNDSTTSFATRFRGYLNVTPSMVGRSLHFGFYADDAVSFTVFDQAQVAYPVVTRPPQLGAPTWRTTNAVTFTSPGLYPVEVLYAEIVEFSALEMSILDGTFTDFELPANQSGSVDLAAAGFQLLTPAAFQLTEDGSLPTANPNACTQCLRQNANAPGNGGCGAGNYCNAAAICAPCTSSNFCGPSCTPCNGSTPVCATLAGVTQCVQCKGDQDCRPDQKCNAGTGQCQECTTSLDCPRGKVCSPQGTCQICSTDDACAGTSCNCCGGNQRCLTLQAGVAPTCAECAADADCGSGKRCDLQNGRCVDQLPACDTSDRCGPSCVRCPTDRPFCLDGQVCVSCRSDLDCGSGEFCLSGECSPCTTDRRCGGRCESCGGDTPHCDASGGAGHCVQCREDSDCAVGTCDRAAGECVSGCLATCGPGTFCDGRRCVECYADSQCGCSGVCDVAMGQCVSGCNSSNDCGPAEHCSTSTGSCERGRIKPNTEPKGGGFCCASVPAGDPVLVGFAALLLLGVARSRRLRRGAAPLAVGLLVIGTAASAQTESRFDVQLFRPSGAPADLLMVQQSRPLAHFSASGGLVFNFALDPLVLVPVGGQEKSVSVLLSRLQMDAAATLGLFDWAEVGVTAPVVLFQASDNLEAIGTEGSVRAFALGDVRITSKIALPGLRRKAEQDGFGGAFTFSVSAPTGSQEAFASEGAATAAPGLVFDYRFKSGALIALNLGAWLRPDHEFAGAELGNMAQLALGAEVPIIRRWGITAVGMGYGSLGLLASPTTGKHQAPAEILGGLRWYSDTGVTITTGGGGGCGCGLGAPAFRFFASAVWVPGRTAEWEELERFKQPPVDPDHDGVIGDQDRCPSEAGPVENYGCPDEDGDGLLGTADRCPRVPGPPENYGCPDVDSDRDGTPDRLDQCPNEPVEVSGRDGCPLARVIGNKITILDQVHFATDQDVILPESYETLEEVARILKEHPEIQKVLVEGHTDVRASDTYNMDLSQRRAASVKRFLEEHKVDPARLRVQGFGRRVPIAPNDSEAGMALNRRVEFTIEKVGPGSPAAPAPVQAPAPAKK